MAGILLLEPDSILANLYILAFEHQGHQVRRVVSAQDGVFQIDTERPDLILVELQLVAHSGIEFLYELRSYPEWQGIPVLVHSTVPPTEFDDSMELMKHRLGISMYLYKPQTSLQMLLRAVSETLTAHASAEAPALS